jgi:hypothetical protein
MWRGCRSVIREAGTCCDEGGLLGHGGDGVGAAAWCGKAATVLEFYERRGRGVQQREGRRAWEMETVPSIGAAEAGASSGGNEAVAPHLYRRDRASWRARLSPSWLPMIRESSDRQTTWSASATAAQPLDGETDSSLSPMHCWSV